MRAFVRSKPSKFRPGGRRTLWGCYGEALCPHRLRGMVGRGPPSNVARYDCEHMMSLYFQANGRLVLRVDDIEQGLALVLRGDVYIDNRKIITFWFSLSSLLVGWVAGGVPHPQWQWVVGCLVWSRLS